MSKPSNWHVLGLHHINVPRLLVKSHFSSSGYQVELTDLSRIWREKLSRRDVLQRALAIGSSIDAGEDDEQFAILLSKIEAALSREEGTSLKLRVGNGDFGSKLYLDASAPLPHPLPPFVWSLQLQHQEEQSVADELVTPLLLQASKLQNQINDLIGKLHDKDRVISKICDRLETSGNDLTTVFPNASNIKTSRRKGQREQLAKEIRGLGDFDQDAWRQHLSKQDDGEGLGTSAMNEVFWELPAASGTASSRSLTNWWEHMGDDSSNDPNANGGVGSPHANARRTMTNGGASQAGESMQEDEFQRQQTPPHLKGSDAPASYTNEAAGVRPEGDSHGKEQMPVIEDDESTTEDESDLDGPVRTSNHSEEHQAVPVKQVHAVEQLSSSQRTLGIVGGRSSRPATMSPKQQTPEEAPSPAKPRAKLGTVGGKAKGLASVPVEMEHGKGTSPQPAARTSKLGTLGGKKTRQSSPPMQAEEALQTRKSSLEPSPRPSRATTKEPSPPPRETSRERADRKRDQLKRELEAKAKTPAKKKRKF